MSGACVIRLADELRVRALPRPPVSSSGICSWLEYGYLGPEIATTVGALGILRHEFRWPCDVVGRCVVLTRADVGCEFRVARSDVTNGERIVMQTCWDVERVVGGRVLDGAG